MDYSVYNSSFISFGLTAFTLGSVLSAWLVRLPILAVWFLAISLVSGQVLRLPLPGQGGGLLLSDFAAVIILLSTTFFWLQNHSSKNHQLKTSQNSLITLVGALLILFITWSLFTLALNSPALSWTQLLIAFSYWARLAVYLLLIPALSYLAKQTQLQHALTKSYISAIVLIVILGFAQLFLLPHLVVLGGGWDPHEGRLVSTWLDPNFVGLFLVMATFFLVAQLSKTNKHSSKLTLFSLVIFVLLALALTQSRSSLIALVVTLVLFSRLIILRPSSRLTTHRIIQIVSLLSLAIIGLIIAATLLGPRLTGLVTHDPTVTLRATSLKVIWNLATQHPIVGIGYNTYQFTAHQAGLINDFSIHSRAGADNSFLTLLVTTGLIGLTLFILPWLLSLVGLLRRWLIAQNPYSLAAAASFVALLIHSQFVNSFLYAHLLVTLSIIIAIGQTANAHKIKE